MFTPRLCGGVYLEYKRGDIMNIIADSLSMMMESNGGDGDVTGIFATRVQDYITTTSPNPHYKVKNS